MKQQFYILLVLFLCTLFIFESIEEEELDSLSPTDTKIPTDAPSIKFTHLPIKTDNDLLFEHGRREYQQLMQRKANSLYGKCWANAVVKLEVSCKQMDEYRQSWLALTFTYCFLKTSGNVEALSDSCQVLLGHERYEKASSEEITQCTRSIDMSIFQTYSLFFVHTQSICFYLQAEQWQRSTGQLIDHLVTSAHSVSDRLETGLKATQNIEALQNTSLKVQIELNTELAEAKKSWTTFEEQTREQRALIERILEQFTSLQKFLLVEMSFNSAVVYYLFLMVAVYFATTPKQTTGARLMLYLLLAGGYAIEKKIVDYVMNNKDEGLSLLETVWVMRKAFAFLIAVVYIWWMVTYQDEAMFTIARLAKNAQMLEAIDRKISRLEKSNERLSYRYSDDESEDMLEESTDDFIDSDFDSETDKKVKHKKQTLSIDFPDNIISPVYNLRSHQLSEPIRRLTKEEEANRRSTSIKRYPTTKGKEQRDRSPMKKNNATHFYFSDED